MKAKRYEMELLWFFTFFIAGISLYFDYIAVYEKNGFIIGGVVISYAAVTETIGLSLMGYYLGKYLGEKGLFFIIIGFFLILYGEILANSSMNPTIREQIPALVSSLLLLMFFPAIIFCLIGMRETK